MSTAPDDKPAEAATPPAIPGIGPTPNDAPRPDPRPAPVTRPPTGAGPRLLLAVTGTALACWFVWLSVTALNKSHEPVVSRAQAAMAPIAVRATVTEKDGKPDATVTVAQVLTGGLPKDSKQLLVTNLPGARGFTGTGEYLLLLAPEPNGFLPDDSPVYQLVAYRTSAADTDPPAIYLWGADVEAQAKRLYPKKD